MSTAGTQVRPHRQVGTGLVLPFMPPVGRHWPAWGGRFIGIIGDAALILGPLCPVELDWQATDTWARSLRVGAHTDFQLPGLIELQIIARAMPDLFAACVHRIWTCDPAPGVPQDAMTLDLITGTGAMHWGRRFNCFAVAVRRQPLNWRSRT